MHTISRAIALTCLALLMFQLQLGCIADAAGTDQQGVDQRDQALPEGYTRIVYLNRDGGQYTKSSLNDSAQNTSSVLDVDTPVTIPPFEGDEQAWQSIISCLSDQLAEYNIRVVTDAAPTTIHTELVIGGSAQDAQLIDYVDGLAPQRLDCEILEQGIGFVFSQHFEADPTRVCWAAAHELGHLLGLDHTLGCAENMSYTPACGQKYFTDQDLSCGEYTARDCFCGGQTQNSHQHLLRVLGPNPNQEI